MRLRRALGVREGIELDARFEPGPFPVLATLDPDGEGRRFLLVDAVEGGSGRPRLTFLRMQPLHLGGDEGGAPLGRWKQEWRDLCATPHTDSGTIQPAAGVQNLRERPPILPPLYFCPATKALIPAVCQGCAGPPEHDGPLDDRLCPLCGSPVPEDQEGLNAATALTPLEALWERIRQPDAAAAEAAQAGGFEPFCVACDKRSTCYPEAGPSSDAGTAGALLVPLSSLPWGGTVVEPFHLPVAAWFRLAAGLPWASVRRDLKALPAAVLEDVEERLMQDRRFLFSSESIESLSLESFLLKVETLRQILVALTHMAVGRGHPHLGIVPEALWIRVESSDSLRSALWSFRVVLLDLAPGHTGDEEGAEAERYRPSPNRPAYLRAPGCGEGEAWIPGTLVVRGSASAAGAGAMARVDFLPGGGFVQPPAKGDLVRIALPAAAGARSGRSLAGRVDAVFPEMCKILVHDASTSPEDLQALLGRGQSGSGVRMRIARDHSLVDDLFAAGTIWIASLLANPGDFTGAARYRDELAPRLRGSRAGGGDTLIRESLRAAEASHAFAIQGEAGDAAGAARAGVVQIDRDLLSRALALGMRLCAAVPGGYPSQNHEPAGVEERARAYETLLSMVTELSRQVRERLLGAQGPDDEILRALGAYARERATRARGRAAGATGPIRAARSKEGT